MDWTRQHAACRPVCRHSAFNPPNRGLCVSINVAARSSAGQGRKGMVAYESTCCIASCALKAFCLWCLCVCLFSPFPSLDFPSLWKQHGADMVGQGVARPAGYRWSWSGRWRVLAGEAGKAGFSSAWRKDSASELPWKWEEKKALKVKLYLENYQAVKLSKSFFFLSQVMFSWGGTLPRGYWF